MSKDPIQFTYTVEVDDDKVADGIALAKEMIDDAMLCLAFYTKGCPACTSALFGAVVDLAYEKAQAEWNEGRYPHNILLFENVTPEEKEARLARHLDRMNGQKLDLLREAKIRGAMVHIHD